MEEEQWSLKHCLAAGIPVPKVLLVKKIKSGNREDSVCLESKLPGIPLYEVYDLTETERNALLNQAGTILSKIHSIPVNGFGKFDQNGKGEFSSIQGILNDPYIAKKKMLEIAKEVGLDDAIIYRALEVVEQGSASYPATQSKLVHHDFMPKHILVDNKQVTGIIDFESAIGGDPIMDLAHWHFFYKDALNVEEIIKGYTNKEIFSDDFRRLFNLWRIYLGLMHLKFKYTQKDQKGVDFAKTEITNDINYYNSDLAEGTSKIKKAKKESLNLNYKPMETQIQVFMDRFPTKTEKIDSVIKLLSNGLNNEVLRTLELSITFEELKNQLENCKKINDKEKFTMEVKNILKPIGIALEKKPKEFIKVQRKLFAEAHGLTPINEVLSYGINNGDLHLHLAPAADLSMLEKLKLFRGGFNRLKEIVANNPEIREVSAISWIIESNPFLLRKFGFEIQNTQIQEGDQTRKIRRAVISRKKLLNKS